MTKIFRSLLPVVFSLSFIFFLAAHNPVKADLTLAPEGTFTPAYAHPTTDFYNPNYNGMGIGPDGSLYFEVYHPLTGLSDPSSVGPLWIERYSHDGATLLHTSANLGYRGDSSDTQVDLSPMVVDPADGSIFVMTVQHNVGTIGNDVSTIYKLNTNLSVVDSYVLSLEKWSGYSDHASLITIQGNYLYVMTGFNAVLKVNKHFTGQSYVLHLLDSYNHNLFQDSPMDLIATADGNLYALKMTNYGGDAPFFKCKISNCLATSSLLGSGGSYRNEAVQDKNGYFYVTDTGVLEVYTPTGLLATTQNLESGDSWGDIKIFNDTVYYRDFKNNNAITAYNLYSGGAPSPTPTASPTATATVTPTPSITPRANYSRYTTSFNIPSSYVDIGEPHGMAMSGDGKVWYIDTQNVRLVEMDPSNDSIIRTVGREGSAEGEFDAGIYSVAIDDGGFLFVLSTSGTVYSLDQNGGFMAKYNLSDQAGGIGSINGLSDPRDITYDRASQNLWISNKNKNKVEEFSHDLVYITSIGTGTAGTGNDQFSEPHGIATDSNGGIYIVDGGNARLQVFAADHTYSFTIDHWDDGGTHNFEAIAGVTVLSDGTITVTNQNGPHTVEQFTSDGTYIRTFGGDGTSGNNYLDKMTAPEFVVKDTSNNIYVSDWGQNTISKFSSSGSFGSSFHNNELNNADNTDGKLYFPVDVTYNVDGNMFVLDGRGGDSRVEEYTNGGSYVGHAIASGIIGDGAYHITFGPDGKLYASSSNDVKVFSGSGLEWSLDATISTWGAGDGFDQARGMAFDSAGNLYVVDLAHHRVVEFDTDLEYVSDFGSTELTAPSTVALNSAGHIFVGDDTKIVEYDADHAYVGHVGDGIVASPWSLIIDNDIMYVADPGAVRGWLFDAITGAYIDRFGNRGGEMVQFKELNGLAMNPLTSTLTVADMYNGRVEALNVGYRLLNLIPSANVIIRTHVGGESAAMDAYAGQSLSNLAWDPYTYDLSAIPARLYFGAYAVADFTVDMTQDRDWSDVNVLALPVDSKALVVNLNQTLAPGISAHHSLYISRHTDQHSATVCPAATTLTQVSFTCPGVYTLTEGDPDLTSLTLDGLDYWKIDGLSGTGAFSSLFETAINLKDTMTREKANTASNHDITFGTSNGMHQPTDHFTITFGPDWNMNPLVTGNLTLKTGGTTLTVADMPGVDTWGVALAGNVLTFTAPASGTGYLDATSPIEVIISNGMIINPVATGSYPIDISIVSNVSGSDLTETGNINVPIVDSDQVNVTGFINTFIDFDIDTGTSDVECAYNVCQPYGNDGHLLHAANYTVDLGELNSSSVNKSESTQVQHADGGTGEINSIYFDLITNAYNGAVVTVASQYGYLQGPDLNTIVSVANNTDITANSGTYGYTLPVDGTGNGTIVRNSNCQDLSHYCAVSISPASVFTTNGKPLDYGRLRMDLAAAAAYTNNPGAYHDTLTFIATATF